ncbi:MAG: DNA cytosine methyltransferase [Actinomycetota bacterium]|nr:DNA cytosine methyltransferase [Actinomycetota bacterium]
MTSSRGRASHPMVDLFAGCGGGSIGFRQAGLMPVAAVEIDPHAAAAYEANLGIAPIVRDVRLVTGDQLMTSTGLGPGECTVLFGCPPCQSFTSLRKGAPATSRDRRRNTLYLDYLRLVDEVRPRHIAFENVPGMLSQRWHPHFAAFLGQLEDIGYRADWIVLDAADYGVPQHRRRVLVVGSRVTRPILPAPTHFSDPRDKRRRRHVTVRQAIGDCPPLGIGGRDPKDPLHEARLHSDMALRRLRAIPEGGARADLPPELQLDCHKGHSGHYDIYGRMWWDKPAPTLTSGCTNITRGRFAHPEQDRAITLREAMLLQSFPKRSTLSGTLDAMALQVGNAIPPLLARRIGEAVLEMEALSRRPHRRRTPATTETTRVPSRSTASRSLASSST